MIIKIRTKLILAISILMVIVFFSASYLFINEKNKEIAEDIYLNALAFSKLTSPTLAYNYDLYLAQNSFVYFNREIQSIFEQNDDIAVIKIVSYNGEILYDSSQDLLKRYQGEKRILSDEILLNRVQSRNISLISEAGEIWYLKQNVGGDFDYVNENERIKKKAEPGTLIQNIVAPANDKYSVVFDLDYNNLFERLERMRERIIYLALFGIMLGVIMSVLMSTQLVKPVGKLVEGANQIAKGNLKTRVDISSHDEMSFLGGAFNKMAQDLESSLEARLYRERVGRELELAATIQDQLIPDQDQIPKVLSLDIAADLIPAEEIGGDIYDFLKIGEERLLMYVGDVTGHGVPAGIVSSISSAILYGYSLDKDLKDVVVGVNRVLKAKTMPTMFLTLCLMQWDIKNQKFSYVSAGHEQILHFKKSSGKAEYRPAGGIALGMLADVSKHIMVNEIDFEPGDFLVIYSDGIPECWQSEKVLYGFERLSKIAEKSVSLANAVDIQNAILADVKNFTQGHKQMDDITIMVIRRI